MRYLLPASLVQSPTSAQSPRPDRSPSSDAAPGLTLPERGPPRRRRRNSIRRISTTRFHLGRRRCSTRTGSPKHSCISKSVVSRRRRRLCADCPPRARARVAKSMWRGSRKEQRGARKFRTHNSLVYPAEDVYRRLHIADDIGEIQEHRRTGRKDQRSQPLSYVLTEWLSAQVLRLRPGPPSLSGGQSLLSARQCQQGTR
jgi:hypothetical protein